MKIKEVCSKIIQVQYYQRTRWEDYSEYKENSCDKEITDNLNRLRDSNKYNSFRLIKRYELIEETVIA